MILLLLPLAVLAYVGYFYYRVSKYPKGPFPVPFFGNILQIKDPNLMHEELENWRKKYGDIFTFWMFDEPMVALMRYDVIKDALTNHGDALSDRSGRFPDDLFQSTPNGGVTFSSGENWREQRRTAIHILRDFGVGKNVMEEKVQEQIERCIERIQKEADKNNVDFRWPIQVLVANIINQLLYGFSYPHNSCKRLMNYVERVTKMLKELLDDSWAIVAMALPSTKKLPWLGYKVAGRHHDKYADCLTHVKNDVKDALEYYTKDQEPSCFVQAYYQKIGTSEYLTLPQLYNVCSDFFFAGMETTTTTLRWGLLLLTANPDVQEKIRREVANVVGFERLPTMKDKVNMPYTSAFVTELQRVSNVFPVNIMRKSNEEITLMGHAFPAGTLFLPQVYGSLIDDKKYPDPEVLRPERFLKTDGSYNADLASQTLVFGLGKRQCAGEGLARVELFLTIASFVQKFKFFPSPNAELDLTPVYGTIRFPKEQSLRIEEVDPVAYV